MEKTFKFVFVLAIMLACLGVVGIFLLILKVLLLFSTEIHLMGLTIS